MATREDIEQPLTLEFGGEVEPREFERVLAAFFDVIEGIDHAWPKVRWKVEVKKGSQLIGVAPIGAPPPFLPSFMQTFTDGLATLERGPEKPQHFTDKALRGVRTIARYSDSPARPRLWSDYRPIRLSGHTVANVGELLEGNLVEHGALSGRLQTLSERDGFKFVVYDDLWDQPISCLIKQDDIPRAMAAFGRRVEVFGQVRYRKDGRPTAIEVDDFDVFPVSSELPKAKDVQGILRNFRHDS